MAYIDFISGLHKKTERDYLARVNDQEFPKAIAAERAKRWDYDYWDGDRRINYGGYKYLKDRWLGVAKALADYYELQDDARILDIGCGKGYFLYDFLKVRPEAEVHGLDISSYAIECSKGEIKNELTVGNANLLPWPNDYFDLVVSFNTLHNLHNYDLFDALKEMERVGRAHKYLCVESYSNEIQKANLLYWQVTCEAFCTPKEWRWWFDLAGYTGDHSFIYFD